jgi:hypothetical protein
VQWSTQVRASSTAAQRPTPRSWWRPDDGARLPDLGSARGNRLQRRALDVPDSDALQYGKEFGNRGQCNPTYFTVGNLVKHLSSCAMKGISTEEIVKNATCLSPPAPVVRAASAPMSRSTARRCAMRLRRLPRAAVPAAGRPQAGDRRGRGDSSSTRSSSPLVMAMFIGDAINAIGYRMRPYEKVAGATDKALEEVKQLIFETLRCRRQHRGRRCQGARDAAQVEVDRTGSSPSLGDRRVLGDDHRGRRQLRPAALPRARRRRGRHPDRHQLAALQ